MGTEETHGLGYEQVDDDPNLEVLLTTMDDTAGWSATQVLREWERQQLQLTDGQRMLDVGCGLGDAGLALALDLGADGELVGIDASIEMITQARGRSHDAACRVRFAVGDAVELDEPDSRYDVVRSERTLQWLADPRAAVLEMARVARPGGLVSLIDTDWSTFRLDIDDADVGLRVREAMRTERARPSNIGGRLVTVAQVAGLEPIAQTTATQIWDSWDPDESPAPDGCFSMTSLADDLVDRGQLEPGDRDRFVSTVHAAARDGHFSMTLTMYGLVAAATPRLGPPPTRR